MWNRKVLVRIIEVLLCISCVVALRVTDDESRRVFHYLRNRSREWSLLNNVTWGTIGAALATTTCGGYVIITAGLLVAAATGELRGRKTELFLLGLGIILFGIVGALSLASIDSVPEDLVDNAAVLGALCLLTALVFVVDSLMKIPGRKKKHDDGTQTQGEKGEIVKLPLTNLRREKETKSTGTSMAVDKSGNAPGSFPISKNGSVNTGFDESESSTDSINPKENEPGGGGVRRGNKSHNEDEEDDFETERDRKFEDVGKQLREYAQGFDTGKLDPRNSARYRIAEDRSRARKEYFEGGRLSFERESGSSLFGSPDQNYARGKDETDSPPFPASFDDPGKSSEPIFAKIVNPGVKIMRVEREVGDTTNYRNSDSSQYDNIPIRMRTLSPGILKKNRDVSFNIPANGRDDEIQRLEECFSALQASIGTQTSANRRNGNTPSSPNDPGYVRHTASNWPYETKSKTPGSSPEHDKK